MGNMLAWVAVCKCVAECAVVRVTSVLRSVLRSVLQVCCGVCCGVCCVCVLRVSAKLCEALRGFAEFEYYRR